MADNTPIGLIVQEVDAPQKKAIASQDTTNTGVIGLFERGVPDKPTKVSNKGELRRLFGKPRTGELGILAVENLFLNADPYTLDVYAMRSTGTGFVAGDGGTIAVGTFKLKSIHRPAGSPVAVHVTIAAGTNSGKKITIQDANPGPTITEVFDDLPVDQIVNQINYGIGGPGASVLARVVEHTDILPANAAITAFTLNAADGEYYYTNTLAGTSVPVIKAGQRGQEDPGVWSTRFSYQFVNSSTNPSYRNLFIYERIDGVDYQVEQINGLSNANWVAKINDASTGSKYIYVKTSGTLPTAMASATFLTGGTDGTTAVIADMIGDENNGTGIYAFTAVPVQILTASDVYATPEDAVEFALAAESFAAAKKPNILIAMSVPLGYDKTEIEFEQSTNAVTWRSLMKPLSYVASYTGWGYVKDDNGISIAIPGVFGVLGAYWVRKMLNESKLPNVPPAGQQVSIKGWVSMDTPDYSQADLTYITRELGVNVVMYVAGVGYVARTSRTMATLNKNYDIHKRRSVAFFLSLFSSYFGWLEQLPNNQATRKTLVQELNFVLTEFYNRGMFDTNKGYDGAIAIKCDDENNPEETILARKMYCLVGMRFVNIAETIFLQLANVESSLTIAEINGAQ